MCARVRVDTLVMLALRALRTRVTTGLFHHFSSDCATPLMLAGQGARARVCMNGSSCVLVLQHERRGRQTDDVGQLQCAYVDVCAAESVACVTQAE